MRRRSFLSFALGAPAGVAAGMAGGAAVAAAPEARQLPPGVRMADLGAEPFPNAIRMVVNTDFSETAVWDALWLFDWRDMPKALELVVCGYDLRHAVECARSMGRDLDTVVSVIVNRNAAWTSGRWALRCQFGAVYSPGCD